MAEFEFNKKLYEAIKVVFKYWYDIKFILSSIWILIVWHLSAAEFQLEMKVSRSWNGIIS